MKAGKTVKKANPKLKVENLSAKREPNVKGGLNFTKIEY